MRTCIAAGVCKSCQLPLGMALLQLVQAQQKQKLISAAPPWFTFHEILSCTSGDAVQTMWIGHASCLVQMEGVAFLTDPVFSERCSPTQWAGPKSVRCTCTAHSHASPQVPSMTALQPIGSAEAYMPTKWSACDPAPCSFASAGNHSHWALTALQACHTTCNHPRGPTVPRH